MKFQYFKNIHQKSDGIDIVIFNLENEFQYKRKGKRDEKNNFDIRTPDCSIEPY